MTTHEVDVVIVGAGLSGLTAADQLHRHGRSVAVVEARDRIGGRIHTVEGPTGAPVELGAAFIGPHQHTMHEMARRHRLTTEPTWDAGTHWGAFGGAPRRWRGDLPRIGATNSMGALAVVARIDRMSRRVDPRCPWRAANAVSMDSVSVARWLDRVPVPRESRGLIDASLRSIFAIDTDQLSLLHVLTCVRSAGGFRRYMRAAGSQQHRFADGASALCHALAEPWRSAIRLSSAVRSISRQGERIAVRSDRDEWSALSVIVATPPNLVAGVQISPELPAATRSALTDFAPGVVLKTHFFYESPFWRAAGMSGKSLSSTELVNATFDHSVDGVGALVTFVVGSHAAALLLEEPERRQDQILENLVARFGLKARAPIAAVTHVWSDDEWSAGCFAQFRRPGSWTGRGTSIWSAHHGIHFAGAETATEYFGSMEGAASAGRRAASEVLEDI